MTWILTAYNYLAHPKVGSFANHLNHSVQAFFAQIITYLICTLIFGIGLFNALVISVAIPVVWFLGRSEAQAETILGPQGTLSILENAYSKFKVSNEQRAELPNDPTSWLTPMYPWNWPIDQKLGSLFPLISCAATALLYFVLVSII